MVTRLTPAVMEVRTRRSLRRGHARAQGHARCDRCTLSPNRSTLTHLLPFLLPRPPAQARRRLRLWSRTWFRTRIAVLFWQEETAKRMYAEGGAGRKRDREDFEADNTM